MPRRVQKCKAWSLCWVAHDLVWRQGKHSFKTFKILVKYSQARAWNAVKLGAMPRSAGMQGDQDVANQSSSEGTGGRWEPSEDHWSLWLCSEGAKPRWVGFQGVAGTLEKS